MSHLRAHHLAKSYKGRRVIEDVSLDVEAGQIVGLLGPNGAGKTTCFYMIVGLVEADAALGATMHGQMGDVCVVDVDAPGIGYLPQEASIFRRLTVEENIMAILETRKELSKAERHERMESLLKEFHITHILSLIHISEPTRPY